MPKAGFCKECAKNVWLKEDGSCKNGHPASSISDTYEAEPKKLQKTTTIQTIGVVLIILGLTSAYFASNLSRTESGLIVSDFGWRIEGYGTRYIVGTVNNNSDRECSYAQVQFTLYDSDKNQVGTALANVNNLEPHGTWKFKALVMEDEATSAKLKDVTGF